jgi:hypothetical protein
LIPSLHNPILLRGVGGGELALDATLDTAVDTFLDAQFKNADKSVVTKFLQAHPTDYATKKLQVSRFIIYLLKIDIFQLS